MCQIIDVKYKFNEGFAMIPGSIIISLKITDGVTTKWISNINVDGINNFYLTDKSIIKQVSKESISDKTLKFLNSNILESFENYILDDTLPNQLKQRYNRIIKALYYIPKLPEQEALKVVDEILHTIVTKIVIKTDHFLYCPLDETEFYIDSLSITKTKMKYERTQSHPKLDIITWELPLDTKSFYNISKEVKNLRIPTSMIIDSGSYEITTYYKDNSKNSIEATGTFEFNKHTKLADLLKTIIPEEYSYSNLIKGYKED